MFLCDRRRSKHVRDDRREVFLGTDGLCEKPDTDERSARPAASAGRRPAGTRRPRRQSSSLLLIDTHTHTPHRETWEWRQTHTTRRTQRLSCTEPDMTNPRAMLLSVCRKTKKKAKRTSFSLYLCAFNQGLKAKDNQNPYSCSFSHEKIKSKLFRPFRRSQILWSWRGSQHWTFIYIYENIYYICGGKTCKLTIKLLSSFPNLFYSGF